MDRQKMMKEETWQMGLSSTKERLTALRIQQYYWDFTLIFPAHHNHKIKVHKLILAMSSPVFAAMMFGPLSENSEVKIMDGSPQAFEWLLAHLYYEEVQLPSVHLALEVYQLADKYLLDGLGHICSRYLMDQLSAKTWPLVYDIALLLGDSFLQQQCGEILAASSEAVLSSPHLGALRRSSFRQLLMHPRLAVESETHVFRAIVEWGQDNLEDLEDTSLEQSGVHKTTVNEGKSNRALILFSPTKPAQVEETGETSPVAESSSVVSNQLRQTVREFLPLVRFLTMSLQEIVTCVLPSGILKADEVTALLQKMKGIYTPYLPAFISLQTSRKRESSLKSVVLTSISTTNVKGIPYHHHKQLNVNMIQNFQTTCPISLIQISSTCIVSLSEGVVTVWDSDNEIVGKGVWRGTKCVFQRPVKLTSSKLYTVVITHHDAWCSTGQSNILVVFKDVVFTGQTQCNGKVIIDFFQDSLTCDQPSLSDSGNVASPASLCLREAV